MITGDLLRAAPQAMARAFHPIVLKTALGITEPLAWKDGTMVPIPKSGDTAWLDAQRSILLNNMVGKVWHAHLRSGLNCVLDRLLRSYQVGGRKGMGCSTAIHMASAAIHCAQLEGRTT